MKTSDASQAWILVLLTGTVVAAIAWFIDVVQEWMSDLKQGYCSTNWRSNQNFCCWENKGTYNQKLPNSETMRLTNAQKEYAMHGERGQKY